MLLWIFGLAKARAGKGYSKSGEGVAWFSQPKATPFRRLACVEIWDHLCLPRRDRPDTTKLRSSTVVPAHRPALEFLVRRGIQKTLGARPMKKTVQKFIGDAIRESLKAGTLPSGTLAVSPLNDRLVIQ
jgi:hypothetical protein